MGRDRAAYMRDYRRRQQMARIVVAKPDPSQAVCIAELEDEVRRLKRELASRPIAGPSFNSRGFSPAPKPGQKG